MIIEPLKNATQKLSEGLIRYQKDTSDEQIRDGLIQRFEFTYELSHKILKRYLQEISADPTAFDTASFAEIIRTANQKGLLLGNWEDWRDYREMRSRTSHTYHEETALAVVEQIPKFLTEVQFLVNKLSENHEPK